MIALDRTTARNWWLLVLTLTLLGGFVRFHGLSHRDFWFDESATFVAVDRLFRWPDETSSFTKLLNFPYYALLCGWVNAFGETEASYRSLSALCATLTVPLLSLFAARVGGLRCGIAAGCLAAGNPLHVFYAHEARAYALWVLLLVTTWLLLLEAIRRDKLGWWIAYIFGGTLALYTHFHTAFALPAGISLVFLGYHGSRTGLRWLTATAVIYLIALPAMMAMINDPNAGSVAGWVTRPANPLTVVGASLSSFLPAGWYPPILRGLSQLSPDTITTGPTWVHAASVVAPFMLIVWMVLRLCRPPANIRRPESPNPKRIHACWCVLALGPLALMLIYSVLVRWIYLEGRYDLVAWPAAIGWLAFLSTQFADTFGQGRRAFALVATLLLFTLASLLPLSRMASLKPPPTFHRLRAERLAGLAQPGDLVITFSYDHDFLAYYLHRAEFKAQTIRFPSWLERQIGWVDTASDLQPERIALLPNEAARIIARIDQTLTQEDRVWLLLDSLDVDTKGPRAPLHSALARAMAQTGLTIVPADEAFLIGSVGR